MIDAATYGAPNWVDLSTPDIVGAVEFYKELFDWDVSAMTTAMGDYYVASDDGHEVAGMMQQDPDHPAPASWNMFVYVASVEDTLEKVEDAFGHVLQAPFEIPGGATVSVISDTTGAMFAVISGGPKPEGTYFSNNPGAVCWLELLTRDTDAAAKFYQDVFGWELMLDESTETEYATFRLGGQDIVGMLPMPDMIPAAVPAHWAVYFTVSDCAASAKMAVELGGEVAVPATDISIGRFAVLEDPAGGAFDVMEYTSMD
ncbi:MAG: VOC family protein [Acidimicrobiia bacterium]|nr:VOC family protein [Acidimicrobiia bacterium]